MKGVRILLAAVALLPRFSAACTPVDEAAPLCSTVAAPCARRPLIAVLSAFPAEQYALRAAMQIGERIPLGDHTALVGRLVGQPAVLLLTGIGLINATSMTEALLARFDVGTIVFSGVAGSGLRIGDVAVPARWTDTASGRTYAPDARLLRVARRVAAHPPALARCTPVPPHPPGPEVCLSAPPRVVVDGMGESGDPFGGNPFRCTPGGGDVFGCEAVLLAQGTDGGMAPDATDMETAAVAAVAEAHGVPFVGVRAVSDGEGDPLVHTTPFQQFFDYYQLAADNAAAVTIDLLRRLPGGGGRRPTAARSAVTCAFERVVSADCQEAAVPRAVARLASRACALAARAGTVGPPLAERLVRRAGLRWQRAAALAERGVRDECCAAALATRLRAAAALTP